MVPLVLTHNPESYSKPDVESKKSSQNKGHVYKEWLGWTSFTLTPIPPTNIDTDAERRKAKLPLPGKLYFLGASKVCHVHLPLHLGVEIEGTLSKGQKPIRFLRAPRRSRECSNHCEAPGPESCETPTPRAA